MKKYSVAIGASLLVLSLGGVFAYTQTKTSVSPSVSPTPIKHVSYTLEHSEGSCSKETDCSWEGMGCGGGHGICTNQPNNYKGMVSTCDVNPNFPSNKGYLCGCVTSVGKCGWKK